VLTVKDLDEAKYHYQCLNLHKNAQNNLTQHFSKALMEKKERLQQTA
jgi:hypothetical protein